MSGLKIGFDGPIEEWTAASVDGKYINYTDIIGSFGTLIEEADGGNYHGDMVFVVENSGQFGFGEFGYGSCSHCDALEAAYDSDDEKASVRNDIGRTINWFDSIGQGVAYMKEVGDGRWTAGLWREVFEKIASKAER